VGGGKKKREARRPTSRFALRHIKRMGFFPGGEEEKRGKERKKSGRQRLEFSSDQGITQQRSMQNWEGRREKEKKRRGRPRETTLTSDDTPNRGFFLLPAGDTRSGGDKEEGEKKKGGGKRRGERNFYGKPHANRKQPVLGVTYRNVFHENLWGEGKKRKGKGATGRVESSSAKHTDYNYLQKGGGEGKKRGGMVTWVRRPQTQRPDCRGVFLSTFEKKEKKKKERKSERGKKYLAPPQRHWSDFFIRREGGRGKKGGKRGREKKKGGEGHGICLIEGEVSHFGAVSLSSSASRGGGEERGGEKKKGGGEGREPSISGVNVDRLSWLKLCQKTEHQYVGEKREGGGEKKKEKGVGSAFPEGETTV